MLIHYMSDLHLEFGPLERTRLPKKAEVILLAGDITLCQAAHAYRTDNQAIKLRKRMVEFNAMLVDTGARVFMVGGNHESYGSDIEQQRMFMSALIPCAQFLENEIVTLAPGLILFGASLWTDMNKGMDHGIVGNNMNDFHIIRKGPVGKWSTRDAKTAHETTLHWLSEVSKFNKDSKIIVMTHHCPSYQCVNSFHGGSAFNAGYCTDLHKFIHDHNNIKWWVCGHTHSRYDFQIEQCNVLMNCRGYIGREPDARTFSGDVWFQANPAPRQLATLPNLSATGTNEAISTKGTTNGKRSRPSRPANRKDAGNRVSRKRKDGKPSVPRRRRVQATGNGL